MKQSQFEAMSGLAQAKPTEDTTSWWSTANEDALLESIFAGHAVRTSVRSDRVTSSAPTSRRRRVGALVGVGVVVAAVAIVAVTVFGSGTPGAYAAWSATTTTPPASQLSTAQASCQSTYGASLGLENQQAVVSLPTSLPPLVVSDSRGPYEMLVYGNSSGEGMCLWSSSTGILTVGGGNGGSLPAPNAQSIGVPGVGTAGNHAAGEGLTYTYGHAGAQVTGVTLTLADGATVETTVGGGYYAAWWPSWSDVVSADVTTAQGTNHQQFSDIGPNNPSNPGAPEG